METSKPSIGVSQTLNQYWVATLRYRWDAIVCLLLPLSSVLLYVIVPLYASKILAGLVTDRSHLWEHFWIVLVVTIVGSIANTYGIRRIMAMQANVMHDMYGSVFEHLMQRSVGFYNNRIGGKLVSDAHDYVQSYGQVANAGFITGFSFIATTLTGITLIWFNSPPIGAALTVLLVGLLIWTRSETKKRANLRQQRLKISKRLISHLSDSLVNAVTVKTFAKEKTEYTSAVDISEQLRQARSEDWQRTVTNESNRMAVLLVAQLVLILSLIIITANHPAALSTGIFAFAYTISLINRFFTINTVVRQLDDALLQAQPMTEMLLETAEVQDSANAKELHVTRGNINFSDVSFAYNDSDANQMIFEKLNLHIKPGEKVGLVGHSGGGKTTLTRLLLRFDDVTSGSIAIDGQSINDVTQRSLRSQIAYVPQEPLLFHRSISENIAYSDTTASPAKIKKAAQKAYAADFIKSLPSGYDTVVGERGVKLSGGQRQRVAIARAILKNAPILVLDEATSALDSESEQAIQSALWELMADKTAIVIAHRLSTVQKLDRIIVLGEGKIIEEGTHASLVKDNGLYASLWKRQSGGFIGD